MAHLELGRGGRIRGVWPESGVLHLIQCAQWGSRRSTKDAGKHVTAGIAVDACGNIAPLFLLALGKRVLNAWKQPLSKSDFTNSYGVLHWLCEENWFPPETALHVTECGSVDRNTIFKVAEHINSHVRKPIDSEKHIVLLVEGHSYRGFLEWLEACERLNIVMVRHRASIPHIIQPSDQFVNPTFQQTVRRTRDDLLSMSHLSWANTSCNIKLAVVGQQAIRRDDAGKSFSKYGLWPMDYRFLDFVSSPESYNSPSMVCNNAPVSTVRGHASEETIDVSRLQTNKFQRRIHQMTDGRLPAFRWTAEIACVLRSHYRVNKILVSEIRAPKTASASQKARKRGARMHGAAVLTSNVSQRVSETAKCANVYKEITAAVQGGGRSVSSTASGDKENVVPTGREEVVRNSKSRFWTFLDDVPIKEWPTRSPFFAEGNGDSPGANRQQIAARSLFKVSQPR